MKLSKLLKIMDPDSTISVIDSKSHKPVFEGEARDFSTDKASDKEWKVKRIDNSYTCNFEIYVKEIKQKDEQEVLKYAHETLKDAPL